MSFESAKSMGKAAIIMMLLGIIIGPIIAVSSVLLLRFAGPAIIILSVALSAFGLVGNILFLVAMNRFASLYREPGIFKNALYGFLSSFVGGTVFVLLILGFLISVTRTVVSQPYYAPAPAFAFSFLGLLILFVLGAFIVALLQAIFYRRAFYKLAEKSGEENFRTAGLLMFIGGILAIIFVGALIYLVGWIFAAVGFFSVKPPPVQPYQPTSSPTASAQTMEQKTCPKCGSPNSSDATYCSYCGAKF